MTNSDELGFEDRETAMMIQKNKKDNAHATNKVEYID